MNILPDFTLAPGTIVDSRYRIDEFLKSRRSGQTVTGPFRYAAFDLVGGREVELWECFYWEPAMRGSDGSVFCGADERQKFDRECEKFIQGIWKSERLKLGFPDGFPNIALCEGWFRANGTVYAVAERADGIVLSEYISMSGTMTFEKCMELLTPLIQALRIAHANGAVHGYISEDMIAVKKNGTAVLTGMGLGFERVWESYRDSADSDTWEDEKGILAVIFYCLTGKRISDMPGCRGALALAKTNLSDITIMQLLDGLEPYVLNRAKILDELVAAAEYTNKHRRNFMRRIFAKNK